MFFFRNFKPILIVEVLNQPLSCLGWALKVSAFLKLIMLAKELSWEASYLIIPSSLVVILASYKDDFTSGQLRQRSTFDCFREFWILSVSEINREIANSTS